MNGVALGADIRDCSVFGRASRFRNIFEGLDWLEYAELGLIIGIEDGRVQSFDCPIALPESYTNDTRFRCSTPLIHEAGLTLGPTTAESDLEDFFGRAIDRDEDDEEIAISFERKGITHEFEFHRSEGPCLTSFTVNQD